MYKLLLNTLFAIVLIAGLASGSSAGHYYHGSGMQMSEMSEIDSNEDGMITFDEFSAPSVERLKSGFDMLDSDNDKKISEEEWEEFLRVHGFEKKLES